MLGIGPQTFGCLTRRVGVANIMSCMLGIIGMLRTVTENIVLYMGKLKVSIIFFYLRILFIFCLRLQFWIVWKELLLPRGARGRFKMSYQAYVTPVGDLWAPLMQYIASSQTVGLAVVQWAGPEQTSWRAFLTACISSPAELLLLLLLFRFIFGRCWYLRTHALLLYVSGVCRL